MEQFIRIKRSDLKKLIKETMDFEIGPDGLRLDEPSQVKADSELLRLMKGPTVREKILMILADRDLLTFDDRSYLAGLVKRDHNDPYDEKLKVFFGNVNDYKSGKNVHVIKNLVSDLKGSKDEETVDKLKHAIDAGNVIGTRSA